MTDDVGSLEDELRKLGIVLTQWAQQHADQTDHESAEEPAEAPAAEPCVYCPICQAIRYLRGDHAEGAQPLLATAAQLINGLTDRLQHRWDPPPQPHSDDESGAVEDDDDEPHVQQIEVS